MSPKKLIIREAPRNAAYHPRKGECGICFPEKPVDLISCFCGFEACKDCWKQWIKGSVGLARCMSCNKTWTDGFIVERLGLSYFESNAEDGYRTHYKEYVRQIWSSRVDEIALLVGDVAAVAESARKKARFAVEGKEMRERLSELKEEISNLSLEVKEPPEGFDVKKAKLRLKALRAEKREANIAYIHFKREYDSSGFWMAQQRVRRWANPRRTVFEDSDEDEDPEVAALLKHQPEEKVRKVLCACPYEGCTGLVVFLDSKWRCVMDAAHVVCKKCLSPSSDSSGRAPSVGPGGTNPSGGPERPVHRCDPDAVATVESFAKNTKPCPKCGALIFRAEGCTIMWCTACNNGFDWTTGRHVPNEQVHNPHFTEWRARQGGGRGEARGCGAGAEEFGLDDFPRTAYPYILKSLIEFYHGAGGRFHAGTTALAAHLERVGMATLALLIGEIDRDGWTRRLFLAEREVARKKLERGLYETCHEALHQELEVLQRQLAELGTLRNADPMRYDLEVKRAYLGTLYRLDEFRHYINGVYVREGAVLGTKSKTEFVTEEWRFADQKYELESHIKRWKSEIAHL